MVTILVISRRNRLRWITLNLYQLSTAFKYAAGAALLFVALSFVKIGKIADGVQVAFNSFRLGGSFLYPEIFITLSINNPVDASVKIDKITGSILFDDRKIADIYRNDPFELKPYQKINVEFLLRSQASDLIDVIKKAISGSIKNKIFFDGSIYIFGAPVPVKTNLI